jgi:HEAT repeat protein
MNISIFRANLSIFRVNLSILRLSPLLFLCSLLSPALAQSPADKAGKDSQLAREFLANALRDPNTTAPALGALRLTEDPGLVGLYAAYSSHPDKRVRLMAAAGLTDLKGEQAVAALTERMRSDPIMAIRAQAIAILLQLKGAAAPQLQEAMKCEDQNVQYLAARGLVKVGRGDLAADALAKLALSKDPATAGLARLDLLGLGQADQLEPLTRLLSDANTPPAVVGMILERVQEDKVAALAGLAEQLSVSTDSEEVRLHAFRAVSAISADAGDRLEEALGKTDKTNTRILLFRMLTGVKDAPAHLKNLSQGAGLVAALAKFELARPAMDDSSAQAASELAAFAHPIILGHLTDCLKDDLAKTPDKPDKMDVYTPALLDIVRKTPKEAGRLGLEQEYSARAATLLADIGTPRALEGLKEVLAGPFGEPKRAVAGGMVRAKNPAAVSLVRPLLESPYPELAATSAIALARQGDKTALKTLQDIVAHSHRYSPDVVMMVSWYSLKLSGEQAAELEALIKAAK